jgi:hypothetical protein
VKNTAQVADAYQRHFGMTPLPSRERGWLECGRQSGGYTIALHQASAAQKSGAAIKIAFGVGDAGKFQSQRERQGLKFGPFHQDGPNWVEAASDIDR